MPQFDWLCDVYGCVMSNTSGIYWVDLGFINNYKEPKLWQINATIDIVLSNATATNYFIIFLQNVDVANFYWFSSRPTINISFFHLLIMWCPNLIDCVMCVGVCVMSPTSGIHWVDLGFINNYKGPQ